MYLTQEEPVEHDAPKRVSRKTYPDCKAHRSSTEGSRASNNTLVARRFVTLVRDPVSGTMDVTNQGVLSIGC